MKRSLFVTGCLAAAAMPQIAPARTLSGRLRAAARAIPGTAGIFARTMADTPPLFAWNQNHSFPSASTIKLLIMLAAFERARAHPGVMRERITYHSADLIGGSEFLADQRDGATFTVKQLIVPMIARSDNTASNLLISHFGFGAINATARRAGLHNTHLRRHFLDYGAIVHHMDNRTTPADMAHLLYQIERAAREEIATVATPLQCREMLQIMLRQTDRNKIPAGLPPGVACANKTGEIDGARNDVAVIEPFGDSPYILTVFTDHLRNDDAAVSGIADISRIVYTHVAGTNL